MRSIRVGIMAPGLAAPGLTRSAKWSGVIGGADSIWFPDHLIGVLPRSLWKPRYAAIARYIRHADGYLDPLVTLGWLAAKTPRSRLRLGVAVTDVARRHPAVVAQAFASLHLMSQGRAMLGVGCGAEENHAPYGISSAAPVSRLEEGLKVIRALWSDGPGPISFASERFPMRQAIFDLPPYRGTRPPVFVGGQGPRMLNITGALGDGWLPNNVPNPDDYGRRLAIIRTAASNAGRNADAVTASGWFPVITGPSRSAVEANLESPLARSLALLLSSDDWRRHGVEHPLGNSFAGAHTLQPQMLDETGALTAAEAAPKSLLREHLFVGTPREIVERMHAHVERGLTYPIITNFPFAVDIRHAVAASASFLRLVRMMRRL